MDGSIPHSTTNSFYNPLFHPSMARITRKRRAFNDEQIIHPLIPNVQGMFRCCGHHNIIVRLAEESLWKTFHANTTEMIVTKPGRKLFPKLSVIIQGLEPCQYYTIYVKLVRPDNYKYRFTGGGWTVAGEEDEMSSPLHGNRIDHRDGQTLRGDEWMGRPIDFNNFKLTNNPDEKSRQLIFVQSLHKYIPVVYIDVQCSTPYYFGQMMATIREQSLDLSSFIVVTAYQNDAIKKLKVEYNPYAKGIRNHSSPSTTANDSSSSGTSFDTSRSSLDMSPMNQQNTVLTPSPFFSPPSFPLQYPMPPFPSGDQVPSYYPLQYPPHPSMHFGVYPFQPHNQQIPMDKGDIPYSYAPQDSIPPQIDIPSSEQQNKENWQPFVSPP